MRKVCARFVELCPGMGLLATTNAAIERSKFKAVNSQELYARECGAEASFRSHLFAYMGWARFTISSK